MCKKMTKICGIELFELSIKLRPYYFSINSKVFFQQRACNYLSHSTTNHFFSFHLCPKGKTLTYSVWLYLVVTFLANRLLVYITYTSAVVSRVVLQID